MKEALQGWRFPSDDVMFAVNKKLQSRPKTFFVDEIRSLVNRYTMIFLKTDYYTSRKVAGSIPDGVIRIFHLNNPSGRTMSQESTQPLTEMSRLLLKCDGTRPETIFRLSA
jgi:hypothetical protein